ncbi:MAG: LPS export ABC transporter periplasmic protein LptC, partial [Gallionellaceae bacterium]|nr:LPS export ABC transporter periplasmic protein LptC [Gallionellaceae bacterium]
MRNWPLTSAMTNRTFLERLRSWSPLIPPLLLLAGTYWLNLQVQPISAKSDSNTRHDIDYSVHNLSSVTLDVTGKPRHLLTTTDMWHYPDDDTTHLQSPNLVSLAKDRAPIVMTADIGRVSSHGEEVFLYDNVKVTRLANDEQGNMEFTSDYLRVVPDKDQADTDRPVTM